MNGMQICIEKKNLDFFLNFINLTDAIYDICESFMNETIDIFIIDKKNFLFVIISVKNHILI